jgi:PKD repeat protein
MRYFTHALVGIFLFCAITASATTARYRLMFNTDPATTVTIAWDQQSGSAPAVYYGTTDFGTNWASYPNNVAPYRSTTFKGMSNQFAVLTGLTPNTAYYFVIKDSQGTSTRMWFKTAPNVNTERLSFIAGGDSRSGTTQRQNSNRMVGKLRPHAVLFGGDLTNGATTAETQQWMDDWQLHIGTDGRIIPLVVAYGNHENYDGDGLTYLNSLFDTPADGYFAVTFGGDLFRFYTLNTELMPGCEVPNATKRTQQANWLATDLAANASVIWKGAQYHRPMVPHQSSKSNGPDWYSDWAMNFYNYGVRLVVECDAHVVKHTYPVVPTGSGTNFNMSTTDPNAITFIGEGSWGTVRPGDDPQSFTRDIGSFYGFHWVFVDDCTIEIRTIDTQNPTSVSTVSDANIFAPPAGINIWTPSNTPSGVVTIVHCTSPITDFVASPLAAFTGATISFTDISANTPTSWSWDFGDGSPASTLQNPTHVYTNPGTYTVTLTATNANGTDMETKTGYITITAPVAPIAEFTAASTTISAGGTADFTDLSTGIPTSWSWLFPGGTPGTSTAQNPSVTYATPGVYDVTLTVTNSVGSDAETKNLYITVQNTGSVSIPVADPNDDAEEFNSNGQMYLTSSDLEFCYDGGEPDNQHVGIRFVNVSVPQGATITNAWIQFRADEADNTALDIYIHGHDIDNAPIFTTANYNISSRTTTTATVTWSNPPTWAVNDLGPNTATPALTNIVQEIVDRPGWASGNAMAFIFSDNGVDQDERVADSYDGGYGAILNIEYAIPAPLANTPASSPLTCNGANDGTITIAATGGTPPYQYSINGGSTYQTSNLFENLPVGTYNIVVQDAAMNVTTSSISVTGPSVISASGAVNNSSCVASTGSITFTASGGAGSLQYSIDGGSTFQSGTSFTNLAPGSYNYVVMDANSCTVTGTLAVNTTGGPTVSSVSPVAADCNGGCNGTASVTATGGTGTLSYAWNDPSTQTTATATGLCAGNYTVTITDQNGCTASANATVSNPSAISASGAVNNSSCTASTGSITFTASGGTGSLQYSIDGGSTFQSGTSFTNLAPGSYNYVVMDANSCTVTGTLAVNTTGGPTVSSVSPVAADCNGGCNGTASVTATGGTGTLSYAWNDPSTQTTATATGLCAGNYTVTITDQNGCTASANTTVTEPSALSLSQTTTPETTGNDGAIDLTVTGGTTPYTYDWDNDGTGDNDDAQDLSGIAGGTYTVVVTDANGCSESVAVPVGSSLTVAELGKDMKVTIFPNPTTGMLEVAYDGTAGAVITVTDASGKLVHRTITTENPQKINLEHLSNGVYTIVLENNGKRASVQIVKH